jgi:hypothetical protein
VAFGKFQLAIGALLGVVRDSHRCGAIGSLSNLSALGATNGVTTFETLSCPTPEVQGRQWPKFRQFSNQGTRKRNRYAKVPKIIAPQMAYFQANTPPHVFFAFRHIASMAQTFRSRKDSIFFPSSRRKSKRCNVKIGRLTKDQLAHQLTTS